MGRNPRLLKSIVIRAKKEYCPKEPRDSGMVLQSEQCPQHCSEMARTTESADSPSHSACLPAGLVRSPPHDGEGYRECLDGRLGNTSIINI